MQTTHLGIHTSFLHATWVKSMVIYLYVLIFYNQF